MCSTGVMVVGTGRSGTSLTMQALERAGLAMPENAVPPSENNLHGTGEAIALRDFLRRLDKLFLSSGPFRSDGWIKTSQAEEAIEWLSYYFARRAAFAGPVGFADKYPAASVYFPIWSFAANRVGVSMRYVWATRQPEHVMASIMRAYSNDVRQAGLVWARRTLYLLREAPDETLLIPHEGWVEEPRRQVRALLQLTGTSDVEAVLSAYNPTLDHSTMALPFVQNDVPRSLRQAITAWNELLGKRCGLLNELVDRGSSVELACELRLVEAVLDLSRKKDKGVFNDEIEVRRQFCGTLLECGEIAMDIKNELSDLTARLEEVSAENKELRSKVFLSSTSDEEARKTISSLNSSYERLSLEYDELEEKTLARYRARLSRAETQVSQFLKERAVAQKRSEGVLKELAIAQKRSEEVLKELAVAQKRSEETKNSSADNAAPLIEEEVTSKRKLKKVANRRKPYTGLRLVMHRGARFYRKTAKVGEFRPKG